MPVPFSRGGPVHPPVSERLDDWCIECGDVQEVPDHVPSVYTPPECVHPYVPFSLSHGEFYFRTRIDAAVVGSTGFPRSWYASSTQMPFEMNPVEAMSLIVSAKLDTVPVEPGYVACGLCGEDVYIKHMDHHIAKDHGCIIGLHDGRVLKHGVVTSWECCGEVIEENMEVA